MITRLLIALAMAWCGASRCMADDAPDEVRVRRQVDRAIAQTPGHRATLGLLEKTMELSISFGAPAWNNADHEACSRFYVKTGQSLCAAFADADQSSPAARGVLDDLKAALDRVKQSTDADENAWTLRFVFDKTAILAGLEAERAARLVALGQASAARSHFVDAASAFSAATDSLHELQGQTLSEIPLPCRYAPLALSEALFGQKQYAQAASAVAEGLTFVPELPAANLDLRTHFADAALYKLLLDDLRATAAAHPDDAGLQLLVGYHLFFTHQREAAKPFLEKALKLDPKNHGAQALIDAYSPSRENPPAREPAEPGVKT